MALWEGMKGRCDLILCLLHVPFHLLCLLLSCSSAYSTCLLSACDHDAMPRVHRGISLTNAEIVSRKWVLEQLLCAYASVAFMSDIKGGVLDRKGLGEHCSYPRCRVRPHWNLLFF